MNANHAAPDAGPGQRGGLLLDLHSHSVYSGDSLLLPREMVRLARERGLNGIAVTDHETVQGGLAARTANDDPAFLVIPGVEYATEYGHVVGLFLERELDGLPVRRHPAERMMRVPFQQVVHAVHAQGGLAVLAHPYQNRLTLPDAPFMLRRQPAPRWLPTPRGSTRSRASTPVRPLSAIRRPTTSPSPSPRPTAFPQWAAVTHTPPLRSAAAAAGSRVWSQAPTLHSLKKPSAPGGSRRSVSTAPAPSSP